MQLILRLLFLTMVIATRLTAQAPDGLLQLADSARGWDSTTPRERYDDAVRVIERALDRQGKSAQAWYALGMLEEARDARGFLVRPSNYHAAGLSHWRAAMEAYRKATTVNPAWAPAADALARVLLRFGHRRLDKRYRPALQKAALYAPGPGVHLALTRLWLNESRPDSALSAMARFAKAGGDAGVEAVERARLLQRIVTGDSPGEVYLKGLEQPLTEEGCAAYREDLGWIANPGELEQLDSLPLERRADWIRNFWSVRDALELRTPGERLGEHLRRWSYAHEHFPLLRPPDVTLHSEGLRENDTRSMVEGTDPYVSIVLSGIALNDPGWKLYRRTQWEVDDRGMIYVRHGEPSQKVSSTSGPPNESWLYMQLADHPIFHFLGSHALGTSAATTLVASLPFTPEMLDARGALDPKYTALGAMIGGRASMLKAWVGRRNKPEGQAITEVVHEIEGGTDPSSAKVLNMLGRISSLTGDVGSFPSLSAGLQEKAAAEDARGRAAVARAVITDDFPLVFDEPLKGVLQLDGVGIRPGAGRRILAVFAVDGGTLLPQPRPDGKPGWYYPLAVRLIALDRQGAVIRQIDTVRHFVSADSLATRQYLTGYVELPVPAGVYQVRGLLSSPSTNAGATASRDGIDLRLDENALQLSDIIMGRESSNLAWRFGQQSIPLNPLNAFPRGGNALIFYEAGGLTPGAQYETTFSIRRSGQSAGDKALVEVVSAFQADDTYQVRTQSLGLEQLKPGSYRLNVSLSDPKSGQVVVRSQDLIILSK